MNKPNNIDDGIIHLNGDIAQRKNAEQRLKQMKESRRKGELTDAEDENLDELRSRLARRAHTDEPEELVKSLQQTCSNFLRRRTRRRPETLAKSLKTGNGARLILPVGGKLLAKSLQRPAEPPKFQSPDDDFFLKANNAFDKGVITGIELNTVDVCMRGGFNLVDADLIAKIKSAG